MSNCRTLAGPAKWYFMLATWAGIGITIFFIFRLTFGGKIMLDLSYYGLLLALYLPLAFLLFPATHKAPRDKVPWYDILLAVASAAGPVLVFFFGSYILVSVWPITPPPLPFTLALITWILILEAVRRATGWIITVVFGSFSVYPLFAYHMPDILFAKSYSLQSLAGYLFLLRRVFSGYPGRYTAAC